MFVLTVTLLLCTAQEVRKGTCRYDRKGRKTPAELEVQYTVDGGTQPCFRIVCVGRVSHQSHGLSVSEDFKRSPGVGKDPCRGTGVSLSRHSWLLVSSQFCITVACFGPVV
jgi:hypothetical protein